MEIVEQTIISVEIEGKRIEFPDKASAAETVNVLKVVGKFLQEGQQVAAARALKKYFESNPQAEEQAPKARSTSKRRKAVKKAETPTPTEPATKKSASFNPSVKKAAAEKPQKATRNILPNPPGFARPVDTKTGKPQRGRAPNSEKVDFAAQHAGNPEVQAWAKENEVVLPQADAPKPVTDKPTPPPPPTSDAKPPAPPVEGFGPPPVGPPPSI